MKVLCYLGIHRYAPTLCSVECRTWCRIPCLRKCARCGSNQPWREVQP